ncbi:phage integrase SAM-like domain-containing protein [Apibacter mensalis]|uniref:phage integrase SAM-like domain-containing protein n=1 Tax=Apibacter mensalis TaxID=1586267 RepID=UPI0009EBC27E|nr:phage integrase SAM-like domain-containing protein [Apibacter mensalis]
MKLAIQGSAAYSGNTLNSLFHQKIETLHENNQIGDRQYYQCALTHIERFAGKNIVLSQVTVEWLKRYEQDSLLRDTDYTTIGMYCRAIRHLMNGAQKKV